MEQRQAVLVSTPQPTESVRIIDGSFALLSSGAMLGGAIVPVTFPL